MAERPEAPPEGWTVRHRPAVIAALATPVVLAVLLFAAGWLYNRDLRPSAGQPVTPFPPPGLDTFIHDGVKDPHRPHAKPKPDPQIAGAKRALVAQGIAGWERQP